MQAFHKEGFSILSLLHRIFSNEGTTISGDAQYQGWNIGVEHRYFHPTL